MRWIEVAHVALQRDPSGWRLCAVDSLGSHMSGGGLKGGREGGGRG